MRGEPWSWTAQLCDMAPHLSVYLFALWLRGYSCSWGLKRLKVFPSHPFFTTRLNLALIMGQVVCIKWGAVTGVTKHMLQVQTLQNNTIPKRRHLLLLMERVSCFRRKS